MGVTHSTKAMDEATTSGEERKRKANSVFGSQETGSISQYHNGNERGNQKENAVPVVKEERGTETRIESALQEETHEDFILRLQMEDIEENVAKSKGKQRAGVKNDFEIALDLYHEELLSLSNVIKDHRMAQSMVRALNSDHRIIDEVTGQEAMASNDRRVARAIDNGFANVPNSSGPPQTTAGGVEKLDGSLAENLNRYALAQNYDTMGRSHNSVTTPVIQRIPYAESSSTAASRETQSTESDMSFEKPEERECEVCTESVPVFDLANLPCRHDYCRDCLTRLFADSMKDESLFPPRCCKTNIIEEHVRMFLDPSVAEEFDNKKEELGTAHRTYCRNQTCSAFIPLSAIDNDIATCVKCGEATCSICNGPPHETIDCPQDSALDSVLEAARQAHWQRCYSCGRVVELTHGCNHIVCRCGAEFCYNCGERWHTCACEEWSEARLLDRARAILNRQVPLVRREQPAAAAPAAAPVQLPIRTGLVRAVRQPNLDDIGAAATAYNDHESDSSSSDDASNATAHQAALGRIVQNLRLNHQCEHSSWRYIPGRHQCEECTHWLPNYIFECRQCQLWACYRCRRNRL